MKIWNIFKNFWDFTGEIDVDPKEELHTIENTNKISAEDKATLLKVLRDVDKKEVEHEAIIKAQYTSRLGGRLQSSISVDKPELETKAKEKQHEDQDELEI